MRVHRNTVMRFFHKIESNESSFDRATNEKRASLASGKMAVFGTLKKIGKV